MQKVWICRKRDFSPRYPKETLVKSKDDDDDVDDDAWMKDRFWSEN